LAARTLLEALN